MVKKKHKITIKWSLVTVICISIIIPLLLVSSFFFISGKKSTVKLSNTLLKKIEKLAVEKVANFLEPIYKNINFIENFSKQEKEYIHNKNKMYNLFYNIMNINNNFMMVYFADTNGNSYTLRRMDDGSISQNIVKNDGKLIKSIYIHKNKEYKEKVKNSIKKIGEGYDPRKRPWYKEAIKSKKFSWSRPYVFSTKENLGVSGSKALYNKDKKLIGVISIDINIEDISKFLNEIKITDNSIIYIYDDLEELISLPKKYIKKYKKDKSKKILTIKDLKNPIYIETYKEYKKKSKSYFLYEKNSEKYDVAYISLNSKILPKWNVGIIIPQKDTMNIINEFMKNAIFLTITTIIITIFIALLLVRRITIPLNNLEKEMLKIKFFHIEEIKNICSNFREIDNINNSLQNVKNALLSFRKYVPYQLVRELIKNNDIATNNAKRKNITMLFSDIENFTSISESMDSIELVKDLEKYFDTLTKNILKNNGIIDKYIGDAIFAFWGAPNKLKNHEFLACKTAIKIQKSINELNTSLRNPLNTRIGIHNAKVVVGNIGSKDRINYTAIGDGVNLASRLEGINKYYKTKILISKEVFDKCENKIIARLIDNVVVKGKNQNHKIYELIDLKTSNTSEKLIKFIKDHNYAMNLYFNNKKEEALNILNKLVKENPDDLILKNLIVKLENKNSKLTIYEEK